MKTIRHITTTAILAGSMTALTLQAEERPTYKADVPKELLTPDKMESSYLGELTFQDGFPTVETASKVSEFVDTSRAVELFINGTPAASMYAMLNGHVKIGFNANHTVGITEELMNARSLWLTPQTTTPYVHAEADVKDGPVVIEIGTPVIGLVNDAFFRYVTDLGLVGADKGKGGKYLLVGPDYEGEIPEGYFVSRTSGYRHWVLMRIAAKPGQTKEAVEAFKKTFKIYPLADAKKPKPMVGKGSVYEIGATDINGKPLDGGKTYKVTLPAPIPAKDFWSFMVYDNQTRSILETDQVTGGLDSNSKGVKLHDDGSATVYFSPKAPEGQEGNWVQTMSGKGYNVLLRLYGPLEPWFDKTWMPGDFEPVN